MTVSPIALSERRRGRPSAAADEASTPTGRALHWIEARLLDGAHAVGLFASCHEIERIHDANRDRINRDILARQDAGEAWIEVRADFVLANIDIDALADAADAEGARHVHVSVRRVFQRLGGFVERSFAGLLGRGR